MKKVVSLLLIIACLSSLTGCFTVGRRFDYTGRADEIASVEIYECDIDYYREGEDELGELLSTLDEEDYKSFTKDLKKKRFSDVILLVPMAVDPYFGFRDYVIRIEFENGDYCIIGDGHQCLRYAEGGGANRNFSCRDDEKWNDFIEKHLPQMEEAVSKPSGLGTINT